MFAAVRSAGEKEEGLEPARILQLFDEAVGERHASGFVHVKVVRFIHNDEVPRIRLQHPVVTARTVLAQRMEGGHDVRIELPKIEAAAILGGLVLGHADVEHAEKAFLPLVDQRSGAENEQPLNQFKVEQPPEDKPSLNGFAEANIIGNYPPNRPLFRDLAADPKLVRI